MGDQYVTIILKKERLLLPPATSSLDKYFVKMMHIRKSCVSVSIILESAVSEIGHNYNATYPAFLFPSVSYT